MRGITKISLEEAIEGLDLADGRANRELKFPLVEILFLIWSAMLWGATNFVMMEEMAKEKLDWLREFLPYTNGIPCARTLRNVMRNLDADKVHELFSTWMRNAVTDLRGEDLSLDGKALRGAKNADGKAPCIVNAHVESKKLVLGQVACSEKSNEITAIPELLDMFDITGATITIDAAGTQVAIVHQIREAGGEYLLPVKKNRKTDFEELRAWLDPFCETQHEIGNQYAKTIDKGHGRIDKRECWMITDFGDKPSPCRAFPGLHGIAKVRNTRTEKDRTTVEDHYFIFSHKTMDAATVLKKVRSHWGVETMHNILDVTFREDASRAHADHTAENLNAVRELVYNSLRQASLKGSFAAKQMRCLVNHDVYRSVVEQTFGIRISNISCACS